jgi:negative regulator of sigma E activity
MQMMRTLGNVVVIAALAVGSSATAAAQSTAPGALPAQAGTTQGLAEQLTDARLGQLYSVLRITVTERPAWSSFAQTAVSNARTLDQLNSQRDETLPRMNAVQNMQSYASVAAQQGQSVRRAVPVFQTLYVELTPTQQQAADQQLRCGSGPAACPATATTVSTQSTATPGAGEQATRAHLDQLSNVLHITANQQPAWNSFAQTALSNARALDQLDNQRAEALPRMNAVENMQSYANIATLREQNLQRAVPALQTLYANLTPTQQQAADQHFRTVASERVGAQ